jgi:hypothetical protein
MSLIIGKHLIKERLLNGNNYNCLSYALDHGGSLMNKYKIVDWMNNRIFPNKIFKTFEDGWEYIYNKFPNEEDHQEYYVVNLND